MTKRRLMSAVLLIVASGAMAQMPTLPMDEEVKTGVLANGLTYYIRHNEWPEHRANFYIAQRVGSLQEEEDQRGLAHFLEHMAFNGSRHFPADALVRWCESIGVKFGVDLNAYTSIDQTVYRIDNVPTDRQSALDSCLLILADWSGDLLLEDEEIDKERGVIHEEWRLRSNPAQRMYERNLEALYPGSKYGRRLPIGLMSVVDSFTYNELRDYYAKWYNPENQAIIVVGDIDADYTEKKIKALFSSFTDPKGAGKVTPEEVPDNAQPIVVVDKDREQRTDVVQLMFKHDAFPDSMKNTPLYLVLDYVKNIAVNMLRQRLHEASLLPDCPYVQAGVDYEEYLLSRVKESFDLYALPKDGMTEASLTALVTEARRAAEYGFTSTEMDRAKADWLSSLEKRYSNRDKRTNALFAAACRDHFLSCEPMTSIDVYYPLMKQAVPLVPLETVNGWIRQMVSRGDSNVVIISLNTEKEGAVYPTREGLLAALEKGLAAAVSPYVDKVKDEPIIDRMPKKGSIKKVTPADRFGYTVMELSNGARVLFKETDYKKDEVRLEGEGPGGYSLYGEDDYTNLKVVDDVVEASGLGNFSHDEFEKALAGKIAGATFRLGQRHSFISASSTPKDVETMLQIVYLYFVNIKKDQESYDNWYRQEEISLRNRALSPEAALSDSLTSTLYNGGRREMPLSIGDMREIDYARCLEIAREQLANARGWTFTVIGNISADTLRPLIERYIASLPSEKESHSMGPRVDKTVDGEVTNIFYRRQETPKSTSYLVLKNEDMPYNLENSVRASIAGQILSMIYLKKIREDSSAAYSVGAYGEASRNDDYQVVELIAYCPMKPEKQQLARRIMREEIDSLRFCCDEDKLRKVKDYMLKNHETRLKTNSYWRSVIDDYDKYGIDMVTDYNNTVERQTPATITAFIREFLKPGNIVEVTMLPEQ